jgi:MoaA/NifB/PqqE/SkfB family radical SAM enzyme
MKRKKLLMKIDDFKLIVDKCKDAGIDTILPFMNGESSLHPDFEEAIRYIKKKGLAIYLNTNMANADKALIDFLFNTLDRKDKIILSLDTTEKEIYKALAKGSSAQFDNREGAVAYFLSEFVRRDEPFMLGIQRVVVEENNTIPEFQNFYKKYDKYVSNQVSIEHVISLNWAGAIPSVREGGKRNFCPHLYYTIYILVDGSVCLCCFDYEGNVILGNIYRQSIEEIYNSDLMKKYRNIYPHNGCVYCNLN